MLCHAALNYKTGDFARDVSQKLKIPEIIKCKNVHFALEVLQKRRYDML